MDNNTLLALLATAEKAAIAAGRYIAEAAREGFTVNEKDGGESLASQVVTEVDLKSQEIILSILEPSIQEYDFGLLAEEEEDEGSRLVKEYFWCVDPLDGTLAFTEKVAGYAVSIALLSKSGKPVLGVVFDPVSHDLYTAINGKGAKKNGQDFKSGQVQKKRLTVMIDRRFNIKPQYQQALESLPVKANEIGLDGVDLLEFGGTVMNSLSCLERNPAIFFKLPKPQKGGGCIWDYAAIACIINEAGGSATDFYGRPLELNRKDSVFMNHKGAIVFSTSALEKNGLYPEVTLT